MYYSLVAITIKILQLVPLLLFYVHSDYRFSFHIDDLPGKDKPNIFKSVWKKKKLILMTLSFVPWGVLRACTSAWDLRVPEFHPKSSSPASYLWGSLCYKYDISFWIHLCVYLLYRFVNHLWYLCLSYITLCKLAVHWYGYMY